MPAALRRSDERGAFYRSIAPLGLAPLWESLHALVPPRPASPAQAAVWRWADVRPHVLRAGELIGAAEAIRRVLILENPGLKGQASITGTLYAGLQLIRPGEIAPSHRHSQTALRFVLEGRGAYTTVDGETHRMEPGDFVITPSWTWHAHGNTGDEPVIWLDGLDIPLVRTLDAGFAESPTVDGPGGSDGHAGEPVQPVQPKPEGDALARFGANMIPVPYTAQPGATPLFVYPYSRSREALMRVAGSQAPHPAFACKMQYINPTTGGPAMPTMASFLQRLPAGFASAPYRSTDGTVYSVVEGQGRVEIGEEGSALTLRFARRDHFVVPSWQRMRLYADTETILFSFSDRPVQQALGLWREAFA